MPLCVYQKIYIFLHLFYFLPLPYDNLRTSSQITLKFVLVFHHTSGTFFGTFFRGRKYFSLVPPLIIHPLLFVLLFFGWHVKNAWINHSENVTSVPSYLLEELLVGLRILSIREMVFTLCLILILDPFFSTNTMPLADFWKKCAQNARLGPSMKF